MRSVTPAGDFALFKAPEKLHARPVMSRPTRHDYTFASDNTAGIAPEALAALTAANTAPAASYGEDEWTRRAKELVRGVFETDCEVFFVFNGTAANALALAALCRRHHSILCHEVSHVDTDECGAPEFFTGGSKLTALPVRKASCGPPTSRRPSPAGAACIPPSPARSP